MSTFVAVDPPTASEPQLTVLDAAHVPHAATPTMRFQLHLTEQLGREVHVGALTIQVQIDPARRVYDDETRDRLVELFGAPERWAATTHSFQWAQVSTLVPGFTGASSFSLDVPVTYDLEVAASKYFYSLPGGAAPLSFHVTGMLLLVGADDRMQVVQVPWSCSAKWDMPVDVWRRAIAAYYPGGSWVRLQTDTLDALAARKAAGGHHDYDACVRALLEDHR
jgi:hypothetical protein